jgi:XRE family transcriptional regulator, thiamine biosynthesis regulator
MSQNRISALLGVTQASVSVYLSLDSKKAYGSLAFLNVREDEADRIAARLSSAVAAGPVVGVRTLMSVWTGLLGQGLVCDAHRAAYPSLAACDVCMVEYGRRHRESELSVAEVSDAVKLLEGSSEFVSVMPEVSVNIASAAPGATSPADVVAVPGRVVKVRGRAKAMLPPEAGASVHMAKMLLLAMSRQPELRACINLLYDRRMEGLLRREGLRILAVRAKPRLGVEDPTLTALESKLRVTRGRFDALIEEGGSGIEPNVYLFAKGAREAAEVAIRLAKAYSAG